MTDEQLREIEECAVGTPLYYLVNDLLLWGRTLKAEIDRLRVAVQQEREACAQVADEEYRRVRGGVGFSESFQGRSLAAQTIAAAIRQRGEKI